MESSGDGGGDSCTASGLCLLWPSCARPGPRRWASCAFHQGKKQRQRKPEVRLSERLKGPTAEGGLPGPGLSPHTVSWRVGSAGPPPRGLPSVPAGSPPLPPGAGPWRWGSSGLGPTPLPRRGRRTRRRPRGCRVRWSSPDDQKRGDSLSRSPRAPQSSSRDPRDAVPAPTWKHLIEAGPGLRMPQQGLGGEDDQLKCRTTGSRGAGAEGSAGRCRPPGSVAGRSRRPEAGGGATGAAAPPSASPPPRGAAPPAPAAASPGPDHPCAGPRKEPLLPWQPPPGLALCPAAARGAPPGPSLHPYSSLGTPSRQPLLGSPCLPSSAPRL